MGKLWNAVYNILLVPAVWLFFAAYGIFNSKVRSGFKGRRDLFRKLNESLSVFNREKKLVLIHCSSLGEYQQAIPLVSELTNLNYNIVLSFFSPSGYTNSKVGSSNCIKTYLPFDSKSNISKFLNTLNPEFIIFMRYDLWFNLLYEARNRKIPMYIANARFDRNDLTWTFPVSSSFKRELYGMLTGIFTIDKKDEEEYSKVLRNKETKVYLIGDSKFERVKQAGGEPEVIPELENIITPQKKVFVIGSSWKEDEILLLPVIDKLIEYEPELLVVLVPHEPKERKIEIIMKHLSSEFQNIHPIRYSLIDKYKNENLIIVDRIGLLMKLYSIAYVSYVGGGLKSGLHNILEPAIYNMPILFGNKVKNSDEDKILIETGCGFVIEDKNVLYKLLRKFLANKNLRDEVGEKCKSVFIGADGIAKRIIKKIISENVQ